MNSNIRCTREVVLSIMLRGYLHEFYCNREIKTTAWYRGFI